MSGRRVNPPEKVENDIERACELWDSIPAPLDLREWTLAACLNYVSLPLRFQDDDQLRADVAEAIAACEKLSITGPFARLVAEAALQRISVREHIVAIPGS